MQKKQLLVKPNLYSLRNLFLIDTYKIFSKLDLKKKRGFSWLVGLILKILVVSTPAVQTAVVVKVAIQEIAAKPVVKTVAVSIQKTAVHRD